MFTPTSLERYGVLAKLTMSLVMLGVLHPAPIVAAVTVVNDQLLADESDGTNWAAYGRTYDENHYSPLSEINETNVAGLGLKWFYDLPQMNSVYTAPLAVDGVLYFAVGYSKVYAMEAGSGKLLWHYDTKAAERAGVKLRVGWGIRGIAFWKGKVYVGTHDGQLLALSANTGRLAWSAQTVEGSDDGRYITGAPRVFRDKVIIGHGGADFSPVRGYVTAYDAESGKQAWRFYTVPGDPRRGFENEAMKMAADTWTGKWWRFGGTGGTVWNAMTYDPKYQRVYIGTGNGAPWNQKIRSPLGGDNLFLSSVVALDADTGKYIWHHQFNPGETWDYNAAMDLELATLEIGGSARDVLMTAPKDGFFYIIDRRTGRLVSAEKWAEIVNWAERVDLSTGRPVENPATRFPSGSSFLMHPGGYFGAHGTQPMAYSPKSRLVYLPETIDGAVYTDRGVDLTGWRFSPHLVGNEGLGRALPAEWLKVPPARSALVAWDPVQGKRKWSVALADMINGGVTATAGNIVMQGRADGNLVIYAADSGKELWRFFSQNGVIGQPITYLKDGKQQITVVVGHGGVAGVVQPKLGWEYRSQKRRVLTFSLGENATLPAFQPHVKQFRDDPVVRVDDLKAQVGIEIYGVKCSLCHGASLRAGGAAPDLRESIISKNLQSLEAVLRDGTLVPNGMPKFAELSSSQVEALQHAILKGTREAIATQAQTATK